MSYRPTISVYFGGRPIEIGYYRNWDDENLLYEAVAIALLFSDCRSYEEAKRAVYTHWMPERKAVADSMTDEEREDSVRDFERCSEMPIVIDLSSRAQTLDRDW